MADHLSNTFRRVPRTGVIYVMTEAQKQGFRYGDPSWVNLGQGAPETGDLPGAPPRLNEVTLRDNSREYSPVVGLTELRAAVARLYNARYRVGKASQYGVENVAIASGGRLSLSRLAAALGRTHVGHFLPDYTAYEELLELFELFNPIPIPLEPDRGYAFSALELEREIVSRGLGAVLLSNPSNPTGKLVAGRQLEDWVRVGRSLGSVLLFDEFYSNYIWDDAAAPFGSVSAAAYVEDVDSDPVVVFDGLTKNWRYPGWRIGWTLGPREVIDAISSVGSFLDGGAPHPLQWAALPLLEPENADAEARAIRQTFKAKRQLMLKRLLGMGVRLDAAPAGAFYIWGSVADLPAGWNDGMSFFRRGLEQKVISVPGVFFDVNPGKRRIHRESRFARYVRFSFGPPMDVLERGLGRLEGALARAQ